MADSTCTCCRDMRALKQLTMCLSLLCIFMAMLVAFAWLKRPNLVRADTIPDELRAKSLIIVDDSGHQLARIGRATDSDFGGVSTVQLLVSSADGSGTYKLELAERQGHFDGWVHADMREDLLSSGSIKSGSAGANSSLGTAGGATSVYYQRTPIAGPASETRAYLVGSGGDVGVRNCTDINHPAACTPYH
jgi:hypothetical protein